MARPSDYDPAYCDLLQAHFADGFSFESFGGVVGVSKQTLYNWLDKHPEFLDAKKRYETASQLAWEKRLHALATSGDGNATAIIFGLKNRAPESWRDVKATEITGANGGPVQTDNVQRVERIIVDPANPDPA